LGSASNEVAAVAKIESELQKPYGLLGAWITVDTQAEVVAEQLALRDLTAACSDA
jgi:hypothetical protein